MGPPLSSLCPLAVRVGPLPAAFRGGVLCEVTAPNVLGGPSERGGMRRVLRCVSHLSFAPPVSSFPPLFIHSTSPNGTNTHRACTPHTPRKRARPPTTIISHRGHTRGRTGSGAAGDSRARRAACMSVLHSVVGALWPTPGRGPCLRAHSFAHVPATSAPPPSQSLCTAGGGGHLWSHAPAGRREQDGGMVHAARV